MKDQIEYYEKKLQCEIDLFDLIEAIRNKEKIIIVDARSADAFAKSHIKNAINIPWESVSEDTFGKYFDWRQVVSALKNLRLYPLMSNNFNYWLYLQGRFSGVY